MTGSPDGPELAVLAIRADASVEIGLGHAMRCLAIAQEARVRQISVVMISAAMPDDLNALLGQAEVEHLRHGRRPGSQEDAEATVAAAGRAGARWVVVDGYPLGRSYQESLGRAGLRVVAIDDFGRMGGHCAGVILDQNLGATAEPYASCPAANLLLGPRFALLRREFRDSASGRSEGTTPRILVTMGGSDPLDATGLAVRALKRLAAPAERTVVVGSAYPHRARLEAGLAGTGIRLEVAPGDMAGWVRWADLAIAAGGSTSWELASAGVPMVLVPFADNQVPIAEALAREGVGAFPGVLGSLDEVRLAEVVARLLGSPGVRADMAARGRRLIDGKGPARVLDALARMDHNAPERASD